jgi:hypothetical protein
MGKMRNSRILTLFSFPFRPSWLAAEKARDYGRVSIFLEKVGRVWIIIEFCGPVLTGAITVYGGNKGDFQQKTG